MPKQTTHIRVVRTWLQSLGVLSAVSISREEAELKLAAYVPMLMSDFPDAAFTAASLKHVAKASIKGFPTYPELYAALRAHWREHQPMPPALPAPAPIRQRDEPTIEEIEHVERLTRETVAFLRSSAQPIGDYRRPSARYLTPEQLDRVNPLPGGRKRHAAATAPTAAAVDPDATGLAGHEAWDAEADRSTAA